MATDSAYNAFIESLRRDPNGFDKLEVRPFFGRINAAVSLVRKRNTKGRLKREMKGLMMPETPVAGKRRTTLYALKRMAARGELDPVETREPKARRTAAMAAVNKLMEQKDDDESEQSDNESESESEVLAVVEISHQEEKETQEEEDSSDDEEQSQDEIILVVDEQAKAPFLYIISADETKCEPCWLELSNGEGARRGLIHTLYAHCDLVRRLWALWDKQFSVSGSGAHLPDSPAMAELRQVLEDYAIDWDKRPSCLVFPFDHTHRRSPNVSDAENERRMARPWNSNDVAATPTIIDMNVIAAIKTCVQSIVGLTATSEKRMKAIEFTNAVVLNMIVYIHERAVRLSRGLVTSLVSLEMEAANLTAGNDLFNFVRTHGVKAAARHCPELARRQENSKTRLREALSHDFELQTELNALLSGQISKAISLENCVCSKLRSAPDTSAFDYVWPGTLGVTSRMVLHFERGQLCLRPEQEIMHPLRVEPALMSLPVPANPQFVEEIDLCSSPQKDGSESLLGSLDDDLPLMSTAAFEAEFDNMLSKSSPAVPVGFLMSSAPASPFRTLSWD